MNSTKLPMFNSLLPLRLLLPGFAVCLFLTIFASHLSASQIVLNTKDHGLNGMIREDTPDNVVVTALELRQWPGANRRRTVVLGFDTSSITQDVTEVSLSFSTKSGAHTFNEPLNLYGVVQGFEVAQSSFAALTYNNAPWLDGADGSLATNDHKSGALVFLGSITPAAAGEHTFVSNAAFVNWLNADTDNWAMLYLEGTIVSSTNTVWADMVGSADTLSGSQIYPTLTVTQIPEPATFALLVGMLGTLMVFVRRKR